MRKGSPFLQLGRQEDGQGKPQFRSLPDDTDPNSVEYEWAVEQFNKAAGPRTLGISKDGFEIVVSKGRYGPYFSAIQNSGEEQTKQTYSLDPGQEPDSVTMEDIEIILARPKLPRTLGQNENGNDIVVRKGRFGPYLSVMQGGKPIASANLSKTDDPYSITLEHACVLVSNSINSPNRSRFTRTVLKQFEDSQIQVLDGRYGPYATDGKTNATIPSNLIPNELTLEQCLELIDAKATAKRSKTVSRRKTSKRQNSVKSSS